MPKIPALPPMTSPDTADELPIEDVSASTTKYITLTKLKEWFQALTSFVTTAMITDNNVTASKLATNTIALGQTTKTSSQDITTATVTDVSGLPLTVTIPAGGRDVLLVASFMVGGSNTGVNYGFTLWDGAVVSGTLLRQFYWNSPIANVGMVFPLTLMVKITAPAAGSKTYRLGMSSNGSATLRVYAGAAGDFGSLTAYVV